MFKKILVFGLLFFASTNPSQAVDFKEKGYVSIGIGSVIKMNQVVKMDSYYDSGLGTRIADPQIELDHEAGFAVDLGFGHVFSPWFRGELNLSYLNAEVEDTVKLSANYVDFGFAIEDLSIPNDSLDKTSLLQGSIRGYINLTKDGILRPYIGGGFGFAKLYNEYKDGSEINKSDLTLVYSGIVGFDIHLTENTPVVFSIEGNITKGHDFGYDDAQAELEAISVVGKMRIQF